MTHDKLVASEPRGSLTRRTALAGMSLTAMLIGASSTSAADAAGKLVLLNWNGGGDLQMLVDIENAFTKANPKVTFDNVTVTGTGDQRGAIRTALLGGQKADLLVNAWPAFRKELADAKMLRGLDAMWDANKLGDSLNAGWKAQGQTDGKLYGVTFTYGDRSALYYKASTFEKAGVTPPKTWADFLASFPKLKAVSVTPIALGAKVWSHGEFFETLLLRTAGAEFAAKLAKHEVAWTDPAVKATLKKWRELIDAGAFGDVGVALASDDAMMTDNVLKAGTYGSHLIGPWTNG